MRGRLLTLAIGLGATTLPAQQPQPTFRATTQLVIQTVSVKDVKGQPIEGLTAEDFFVTENGQVQQIAFVDYQRLDDSPASTVTLPTEASMQALTPLTVTTLDGAAGRARFNGRRLVVIYFDLQGMSFFDQMRTFENADRYVATKMTAADVVALLVFDGRAVRVKQDFTDDRAALREVITSLVTAADERNRTGMDADPGSGFGENNDTFNIFETDRQLSALQSAVSDLGFLPQLKTLVYLGSGLRVAGTRNMAQLRATVNAAIRSNVTINPIDAAGLVAMAPLGDATMPSPGGVAMFNGAIARSAVMRGQQAQDTLYALAKDSGGRAIFDSNDLALGIAEATRAATGYYVVGYYTSNLARDGRYRRVVVRLAAGISGELSYRAGYYGEKEFRQFNRAEKERQLADALKLEDPITEIPIAAEINYFQIDSAQYFVPVSVRMPGSAVAPADAGRSDVEIDMIGEIKDEHGVTYRNVRDLIKVPKPTDPNRASPIQYEIGFTVLPGTYVLKLLARNGGTGRLGTFESTFVVPNLERDTGEVQLSSVVLSQQRVAVRNTLFTVKQKIAAEIGNPLVRDGQILLPAVGRTLSRNRPTYIFLQAYQRDSTEAHPLGSYVTCYAGGRQVLETPAVGIDQWEPKTKALTIQVEIPPRVLASGTYMCQVTVLDTNRNRVAFRRASITMR